MTLALDYGKKKRAERQRPEEPDVDPQVRFCERGRSRERSLLDPVVEHRDTTGKAPLKKGCTPEACWVCPAPSRGAFLPTLNRWYRASRSTTGYSPPRLRRARGLGPPPVRFLLSASASAMSRTR